MDITFGRGRGKHWQHLLALLEGLRCTAFIASAKGSGILRESRDFSGYLTHLGTTVHESHTDVYIYIYITHIYASGKCSELD